MGDAGAGTGGAPVGASPLPASASRDRQEAEIIERMCSAEQRASTVAGVLEEGKGPPVMSWGCDLEQCGGEFVRRTNNYLRLTPRFRSLLTLIPCDVWSAVRGRTIWVAGDSQAQRFYRQLRCFLGGFLEPEPYRRRDVKLTEDPEETKRIHDAVLEGHDSCCGVSMPICTYFVGNARVCHARINKGDHMLKYLRNLSALGVQQQDVWELNVGLWHHKKENQYPGMMSALAQHYAEHKGELPLVIWRDNSPQHFKIENGEFPHPSVAWKILEGRRGCQPIAGVQLLPNGSLGGSNSHVQAGGWRNRVTTPLFSGVGMPMHDTWNDSIGMWEGHLGQDCTHFCSPGAYNVWVWSFWRTLLQLGVHGEGAEAAAAAYEATLQQQREAEEEAGGSATSR